jgi:hypothetical protein
VRLPWQRRKELGPIDGSAFYGRHAANPVEHGHARRRFFTPREHRRDTIPNRFRGVTPEPPKVREPRPIRRVPKGAARDFSDGARTGREQPRNDMRISMRRRQRGDFPHNPGDS